MGRYLLAASPIPGHVMPLQAIGVDLRSRGHEVWLLTGAEYLAAAQYRHITTVALPEAARPPAAVPPPPSRVSSIVSRWRRGRSDLLDVFVAPMRAQYQALRKLLDTVNIDAVLCDVAFTGALPLLLTDAKRPAVLVCGVGPLTVSSADTPPFGMGWSPRPGTDYRAMHLVVQRVLFADVQRALNTALKSVCSARSSVFLSDWPLLADRLLQLTVEQAEYPRSDLPASVVFTGPVLAPLSAPSALSVPLLRSLQRCTTVVHVTQGTWHNSDFDDLLRPTVDAVRGRDDLFLVVTTGRFGLTTLGGGVPSNVYVTDFIDYRTLLPYVDVMVTNGGYGGVQHALSHGIPLVVAGETADKHEVAARVAYAGAGINLNTSRPTPDAIISAIDRVLVTETYRHRARVLSREIRAVDPFETIAGVLTMVSAVAVPDPLDANKTATEQL
jgi:UDP:flavonoid glycosyltransferase YjiC (YdhE family)